MDSSTSLEAGALVSVHDASGEGTRAELTATMIKSLSTAQVFRNHSKPVTSLEFHRTGELLVSAGGDETLVFSAPLTGSIRKVLPVKKYGCGIVRFTHSNGSPRLLVTSAKTGAEDAIRTLDVSTCEYERYYHGHTARVVGLAASPTAPSTFLSASVDNSVRLWDDRRRDAVGEVAVRGTPAVAYDPKGLVFSIAHRVDNQGTHVKLYDVRQAAEGPFMSFCVEAGGADPTCFEFSPDGEMFLIASGEAGNPVRVFDAFDGNDRRTFFRRDATKAATHCARFSPDAKFVMTGSDDHGVCLWNMATSQNILTEKDIHPLAVDACAWNPVYGMLATACQNVALWLPSNL